jgi:hypothetical protein
MNLKLYLLILAIPYLSLNGCAHPTPEIQILQSDREIYVLRSNGDHLELCKDIGVEGGSTNLACQTSMPFNQSEMMVQSKVFFLEKEGLLSWCKIKLRDCGEK